MSELRFPNLPAPEYPFGEEIENNSLISTFEDGTVQSRRKFTRSRSKYTVKYILDTEEYKRLADFIKTKCFYSARRFKWEHPEMKKEIEVRLLAVKKAELTKLNRWTVEIELQEA